MFYYFDVFCMLSFALCHAWVGLDQTCVLAFKYLLFFFFFFSASSKQRWLNNCIKNRILIKYVNVYTKRCKCQKSEIPWGPDFGWFPFSTIKMFIYMLKIVLIILSQFVFPQLNRFVTLYKRLTYPRGYSNYFLTGCAAWGLKPLPISKDFSPSKKQLILKVFLQF